jgi:transposase
MSREIYNRERGPAPRSDSTRPLNDVEREIVLADIAFLKQQDIESGDRAKWEEDQAKWSYYNHLRAINTLVMENSIITTIAAISIRPEIITEERFTLAVGHTPVRDDMSRANCPDAGKHGHHFCGWCEIHNTPRWLCHH